MYVKWKPKPGNPESRWVPVSSGRLNQFFGLKEALEVSHLPNPSKNEDGGLGYGPPQHPLVRALTCHAESLLSVLQSQSKKGVNIL